MTPKERVEAFRDEAMGYCHMNAGSGGHAAYQKWYDRKLIEMVRAAEIEALEWAALHAEALYDKTYWDDPSAGISATIRAEIEWRKRTCDKCHKPGDERLCSGVPSGECEE